MVRKNVMTKFAFTVTIKLQTEADTVHEAFHKFVKWRKFIMAALVGRFEEAGISRIAIAPVHEFTEVDAAWLENQKMRKKFQQEWNYETRQEPVVPGSKAMLVHRIAIGPKAMPSDHKTSGDLMQIEEEKEHLWIAIRHLKRQRCLSAIREARQMLRDWIKQHPDDYYSQDAEESLTMLEDALEIIEAEKAAVPVAA